MSLSIRSHSLIRKESSRYFGAHACFPPPPSPLPSFLVDVFFSFACPHALSLTPTRSHAPAYLPPVVHVDVYTPFACTRAHVLLSHAHMVLSRKRASQQFDTAVREPLPFALCTYLTPCFVRILDTLALRSQCVSVIFAPIPFLASLRRYRGTLAQAVAAAIQTDNVRRSSRELHRYFLRGGGQGVERRRVIGERRERVLERFLSLPSSITLSDQIHLQW